MVNYIIDLATDVKDIKKIRNPAAHSDTMTCAHAEVCGDYLIKVRKLICNILSKIKDSNFGYPEGDKEFFAQIFIENGMLCWAIKGYTYSLDKQEDVRAFVGAYNKNADRKYAMHFLPWERKVP